MRNLAWILFLTSSVFFTFSSPAHALECGQILKRPTSLGTWIDTLKAPILARLGNAMLPNGAVRTAEPRANPHYRNVWGRDAPINSMAYLAAVARGDIPIDESRLISFIKARVTFHAARLRIFREAGFTPGHALTTEEPALARDQNGNIQQWADDQNDGPGLSLTELAQMSRIMERLGQSQFVRDSIVPVMEDYLNHVTGRGITHGIETAPGKTGEVSAEAWEEMHGIGHLYTALMQYRGISEASIEIGRISPTERPKLREALVLARKIRTAMDTHWKEDFDGTFYGEELRRRAAQIESEANRPGVNHDLAQGLRADAARLRQKADAVEADRNYPDYPQSERCYMAATLGSDATQTWHFEKTLPTDALSIIGMNHLHQDQSPVQPYKHSDSRWLATVNVSEQQARRLFGPDSMIDGVAPAPRYYEDIWKGRDGANPERKIGEYAWTLVTENFATYHEILRDELIQMGSITIDAFSLDFYRNLSLQGFPKLAKLEAGQTISISGPNSRTFRLIIQAINVKADAYLEIARNAFNAYKVTYPEAKDGETAEGFHPVTGAPEGPENLTWNLSEWLRAVWGRNTTTWATYPWPMKSRPQRALVKPTPSKVKAPAPAK